MIQPAQQVVKRLAEPLPSSGRRSPSNPLPDASLAIDAQAIATLEDRSAAPSASSVEAQEQEINRLTWRVLDGKASLADRQRLAELVQKQHRPRLHG